ncbi:hypothetical protein Dimus_034482 [Dionaea muscipula]
MKPKLLCFSFAAQDQHTAATISPSLQHYRLTLPRSTPVAAIGHHRRADEQIYQPEAQPPRPRRTRASSTRGGGEEPRDAADLHLLPAFFTADLHLLGYLLFFL